MKSLVALVLLAQLLSCKAGLVLEAPTEVVSPKILGCDDPETEEAAAAAVDYINKHLKHGYKVALNRIEKVVQHERRPHGKVMELELDLLETTCHIVSPVPAENCTVRSRAEHAVEGDCDVKMIKDNGKYKVVHTKCHSSPDSSEEFFRSIPDIPLMTLLNDSEVMQTVNTALADFNAANDTHDYYKLLEISRGYRVHLTKGVHAEFAIVNTNCSVRHAKEHVEDCHVETGEHLHYGFCKASFHKAIKEGAEFNHEVHCKIYDHQPGVHHDHLTKEHLTGKLPPAGRGFFHLDLIHSHNGTSASHSHSDEVVPAEKPSSLAKRSVLAVLPPCPGSQQLRWYRKKQHLRGQAQTHSQEPAQQLLSPPALSQLRKARCLSPRPPCHQSLRNGGGGEHVGPYRTGGEVLNWHSVLTQH
uniref:alpha-2-HS-glycoprotein n=1 Tax=Euleptes europaea TaxID=460621 RepID=UPI0025405DAD|nr:alpha-2-HS-glycoprotein [Euleptes europaea]